MASALFLHACLNANEPAAGGSGESPESIMQLLRFKLFAKANDETACHPHLHSGNRTCATHLWMGNLRMVRMRDDIHMRRLPSRTETGSAR